MSDPYKASKFTPPLRSVAGVGDIHAYQNALEWQIQLRVGKIFATLLVG
jgi:hypothetical protein